VPLAAALSHIWQAGLLCAVFAWLVLLRRNIVIGLVAAGVAGALAALIGLPAG